ncbi:putative F420-dependent oxidoreductase [Williamsia limnetica]|uniref:Putative F420-dependent oxidoreductase n=1 Tax=Williamsia limnetica TaxID=882452 RepID=A0A318RLM9_WILLI|nr:MULTISPECIES: LLM class F420-dependent oxidoreductase [Williamsia]OZG28819.1 LLM class F420-dependent oxidoreductase [Williamsia sp. 1138]PYE16992.1 putative F420-dependent oxidoreductase [Williamsia limnetica]
MKLNFQFPTGSVKHWDTWIGAHEFAEIAVVAEASGFDIVSTTDHPFPSEEWLVGGGHHALDPFVALSFMAATTSRIRLLTFILVAGYRNPYTTAKSAASLDLLSGGRLIAGMGAGYQANEFDVLGASFDDRGPRFDEAIVAMQEAWTGEVIDREGPFFPAHGHRMLPRPAQRPGPPIWIGGNSKASIRRVAELADGWLPFEQSAAMSAITNTPALQIDQLAERIDQIRDMRSVLGRSADFEVCFTPTARRDSDETADAVAQQIGPLSEAGVTHISVESKTRSMDACLAEIELLGTRLAGVGTVG